MYKVEVLIDNMIFQEDIYLRMAGSRIIFKYVVYFHFLTSETRCRIILKVYYMQ